MSNERVAPTRHGAAPEKLRAVDLERTDREDDEPAEEEDRTDHTGVIHERRACVRDDVREEEPQRPVGEAQRFEPVHARTVDGVEVRRERARHVEELEGDQDVEGGRHPEQRARLSIAGAGCCVMPVERHGKPRFESDRAIAFSRRYRVRTFARAVYSRCEGVPPAPGGAVASAVAPDRERLEQGVARVRGTSRERPELAQRG